ncbi:helix-turn-helix transcriptional regulator [Pontibacter qinzhouensis]|uniref:Helix-turn-helix transcriptional regulator n=1 Tax=Pontibacter qinzhouensis TaxID=2603253 RepID=A0A5C8J5E3_9BACT|nr:AraC family transcriptional regulator [Pontibacter qinzhouensis]TXK31113.1 helix-turn-helix transcriptional regulator [Pontibacter qinzhouensis]
MKPHIQKLPLSEHCSFVADTFFTPHFETPWHYHTEYELVLILKGKGKRFVGNHVSDYEEGNLTFLGPDVPHLFRKEDAEAQGGSLVIHFKEDFLGSEFKRIPEMQKLKLLFQKSRMGLHITGETRAHISQKMNDMLTLQGMERLICLLSILSTLADTPDFELLSSTEISGQNSRDNDRLNKVFDYVMLNFKNEIQVGEVAELANMSYSGFCRYFKNRTKKNFTHFVNEIRVGYACKRLMESDVSVSNVCYESGYNNLTNFNEQFKKILRCTPYQFQRQHKV